MKCIFLETDIRFGIYSMRLISWYCSDCEKKKISVSPKHLLHMLFTKELLQSLNVSKFLFPRLSWCLNIIDMRKSIGNNFTIFVIAIIQKLLLNFSLIKGKNRIILLLWGDSRILACFFQRFFQKFLLPLISCCKSRKS